jgi:hypothetical protein
MASENALRVHCMLKLASRVQGRDSATYSFCACCALQVNAGGMWEHWCEFRATLDATRPAEPVSISSEQAAAAPTAAAGSKPGKGVKSSSSVSSKDAAAAAAVCGERYRLAGMDVDSTRALPTKGKVSQPD